jgi:flagellar hook-length control protein FliK
MVDLVVTANPPATVAGATRAGGNGGDTRAAFATSFEQLLQRSTGPRHSPAPAVDGLRVGRDGTDRGNHAVERPADAPARPIRKKIEARPAQEFDSSRHADGTAPPRRKAERDRSTPADSDAASRSSDRPSERPSERPDRRRARPPADAAEGSMPPPAAIAAPPAGTALPATQGLGTATQAGATAPATPGTSWSPFSGAADSAEPQQATTASAPGQASASITRDADMLVSQPQAALASAAVLAADNLHGQGLRQRPAPFGPAAGAEPAAIAAAASEAATDPAADGFATPGMPARTTGGPHAAQAATAVAGGADAAAGAGLPARQGQVGGQAGQGLQSGGAAMAAMAAEGAAASFARPPGGPPAAGSAVDARGAAAIADGAAIGGAPIPPQAGRAAAAVPPGGPPGSAAQQRMIGDQVSVHIRKAVHEGADRIEIRLKPEALGRVDVRLEMGADNRVVATVTADQRHTLELLRADARSLERALQEAGLQTDGGSLNFNLRGGEDGRPGQDEGRTAAPPRHGANASDGQHGQEMPPQAYGRPTGRPDGIDIRA